MIKQRIDGEKTGNGLPEGTVVFNTDQMPIDAADPFQQIVIMARREMDRQAAEDRHGSETGEFIPEGKGNGRKEPLGPSGIATTDDNFQMPQQLNPAEIENLLYGGSPENQE